MVLLKLYKSKQTSRRREILRRLFLLSAREREEEEEEEEKLIKDRLQLIIFVIPIDVLVENAIKTFIY